MSIRISAAVLLLSAGAAFGQTWSDDFNRADGPIGGDWTETSGTWAVAGNRGMHTGTGVNQILTHNSANLGYENSITTLDVFRPAGTTASGFAGVLIGLGGTDAIMVKIQSQGTQPGFTNIGIYHRTSATGWGTWTGGPAFQALTAPFTEGRLTAYFPTSSSIAVDIDTDFNGIADQTYTGDISTIMANLGTGHGITAWSNTTSFDNWSVSVIPAPGAAALLGFAGITALRRRR